MQSPQEDRFPLASFVASVRSLARSLKARLTTSRERSAAAEAGSKVLRQSALSSSDCLTKRHSLGEAVSQVTPSTSSLGTQFQQRRNPSIRKNRQAPRNPNRWKLRREPRLFLRRACDCRKTLPLKSLRKTTHCGLPMTFDEFYGTGSSEKGSAESVGAPVEAATPHSEPFPVHSDRSWTGWIRRRFASSRVKANRVFRILGILFQRGLLHTWWTVRGLRSRTASSRRHDGTTPSRGKEWFAKLRVVFPGVLRIGTIIVSRRRSALAVGVLALMTFLSVWWRDRDASETRRPGPSSLELDDVEVLPPENVSNGEDRAPAAAEGANGRNAKRQTPETANTEQNVRPAKFPEGAGWQQAPLPQRMPATPRAVWLTGSIEEAPAKPSRIRRTSQRELPMVPRHSVSAPSARLLRYRRR